MQLYNNASFIEDLLSVCGYICFNSLQRRCETLIKDPSWWRFEHGPRLLCERLVSISNAKLSACLEMIKSLGVPGSTTARPTPGNQREFQKSWRLNASWSRCFIMGCHQNPSGVVHTCVVLRVKIAPIPRLTVENLLMFLSGLYTSTRIIFKGHCWL